MQACRLTASQIACRRGDRLLFTGVSFALQGGQALQLAGPNGIGKSSLIRILAGLARPYAGALEREGAAGLLNEQPALDESLPLGRALDFWARLDGAVPAESLALLGLEGLLDVPVRFLSTGQRKRSALARLIGQRAPIWLLDEPLNGLDVEATALVEQLVARHCAGGGMAIIASHQPFALPGLQRMDLVEFAA